MTGRLSVVGLGPGAAALTAPAATAALAQADDVVGYGPYVARVPEQPGQQRHASDNREELDRARLALGLAAAGRKVAVVSSGDAGVFAMASAVFEALDSGPPAWAALEIEVIPGISAIIAVAARLGAPLGNDFCVLSLSDNLKPWAVVERRLALAAEGGFVLAFYNPISRARPWQLGAAFDIVRQHRPPSTPVVFAAAVSRPDETILITDLGSADPAAADMRTLVLIGCEGTRLIPRADGPPWLYTARRVAPP